MAKYSAQPTRGDNFRRLWTGLVAMLFLLVLLGLAGRQIYNQNLGPVSSSQTSTVVTIAPGSSVRQIAQQLAQAHLIKSAWALELYAHGKQAATKFQAGSYALAPNAGTPQIVDTLTKGQVTTRLVTILPGRRIDQVRADLINDGFSPVAVDAALQPQQYADLAVVGYRPNAASSLEGLLWPDSYQKDATTNPSFIVREALAATATHLTTDLQTALAAQGLSPYQGLTLASIVEQEVSKPTDRAQAAQVFLSRLKANTMLGSDVTANYGAIVAGRAPSLSFDSPYNTLLHPGLPLGPIGSVSTGSLQAVAHPASTDWLYFVAGDDGVTYFSKTLAEHEALSAKYCHKLCGR
ncbi:MAG: endolytic transglycosylase MltG [Patescibacteria group bacterium]|nr:endolytic transglycosylase MltG [Patescibacteria group bacterium]